MNYEYKDHISHLENVEFPQKSNKKEQTDAKTQPYILLQRLTTLVHAFLYLAYDRWVQDRSQPILLPHRAGMFFIDMMTRFATIKSSVDPYNYAPHILADIQSRIRHSWETLPPFTPIDESIFNAAEFKVSREVFTQDVRRARQNVQANLAGDDPNNYPDTDGNMPNPNKRGRRNNQKRNAKAKQNNNSQPSQQNKNKDTNDWSNWGSYKNTDSSPPPKKPKTDSQKNMPCKFGDLCRYKSTCPFAHDFKEIRAYHNM